MQTMTAPKKRGPKPQLTKNLNVWIKAALRDALGQALEETRPRSTLKNVVEAALEEWLQSRGLWPPAGGP